MRKHTSGIALLTLLVLCLHGLAPRIEAAQIYNESGDVVIMEIENTESSYGNWVKETSLGGYNGTGYLRFTANEHTGGDPNSPLNLHFKINTGGTYILEIRCAKKEINGATDLANDCYVRVVGDFTSSSTTLYDIPDQIASAHMLKNNLKYYGGSVDAWEWAGGDDSAGSSKGRLDPGGKTNKRQAIYQFKAGETYTLVVSGRSKDFRIDRIAFRRSGATVNLNGAESGTFSDTPPVADSCDKTIAAGSFNAESHPGNDAVIKDNGSTVGAITDSSWIRFNSFDFGVFEGGSIDVQASTPNAGGIIELRTDSATGPLLGTVKVRTTSGWAGWTIFSGNVSAVSGVKDLYLVFQGGSGALFDLNNFSFHSGETIQEKPDAPPVNPPPGRIALVADGNSPDPDDIGATAAALAMLRVTGLDHRLVHCSHSCDLIKADNITTAQELNRQQLMQTACDGTVSRWGGYPGITFWNCRTQQTQAVNNLRDAINASSASDPLWIIEGGEPDIIGYALQAATSTKRQYVKIITHHPVNDHSGDYFTWSQIENFGIQVVRIPDQNGATFADIAEGLQRPLWAYDWAKNHADFRIRWLWDQVSIAEQDPVVGFQSGKCDISDAGMMLYWITGANVNGGYFLPEMYDVQQLFATGGVTGPESGLVAHWPLNEGSGMTTTNAAGTPYTATLLNGAGWSSDGTRSSYVTFDGTNDRIATTFTYALNATNDFTWAWWANKQSADGTGGGAVMVGNRYPERASPKYGFIKMTPNGAQFANTDTSGGIEKYNYAPVLQGGWHHYAMVKQGTNYHWYVDGVAQGSVSNFNYSESFPIPFLIGGDDDGSGTKTIEHFQGFIDDVVLYRDALSAVDVAGVMNGVYVPNTPPSISPIPDQTILANTNTGPLAFTIGDEATVASALMLTNSSSNTNLVPVANIGFGGSDSNRTVTVTPLANQSGSALISIIVSDGSLSATNSFTLTVWPPGTVVGAVTNSTPGTVMWTCPPGVTNVQVECWGGGGAGGSSRTAGAAAAYVAGGGGAGGAYARKTSVPVTPGTGYALTIGAAAVAADPATCLDGERVNGADTVFTGDAEESVLAKGGQGGESSVYTGSNAGNYGGVGGAGSTEGCVSDGDGFEFAGGNGYGIATITKGGSGGGGAGDTGAGGNAYLSNPGDPDSATLPGAGGIVGGGLGGLGAAAVGGGTNGNFAAGGGGGARTGKFVASSGADLQKAGGNGGVGQIILSYVQLPAVEPPVLGHSMSGGNLELAWTGSGFKVQLCTNLTFGTWQDVPGGNVSPVVITPTLPAAYYRLIGP